jgi:osmotically-inducible protein OsmY
MGRRSTAPEITMSTDIRSQEAARAELGWDPSVTAAQIGITLKAGVVTLAGHVENTL